MEFIPTRVRERFEEKASRYAHTKTLIGTFQTAVEQAIPEAMARERILDALGWMLDLHLDQKDRPDGSPYVSHPVQVALSILQTYQVREGDVIIAALLHDAVEDQAARVVTSGAEPAPDGPELRARALAVIARRYGQRPADLVGRLSNPPEYEQDKTKEEKNRIYLEHIEALWHQDAYAFTIKMVDFAQNALRLDQVQDKEKRNRLRAKYCPVIAFLIVRFQELADPAHPLYSARETLLRSLQGAARQECHALRESGIAAPPSS